MKTNSGEVTRREFVKVAVATSAMVGSGIVPGEATPASEAAQPWWEREGPLRFWMTGAPIPE